MAEQTTLKILPKKWGECSCSKEKFCGYCESKYNDALNDFRESSQIKTISKIDEDKQGG